MISQLIDEARRDHAAATAVCWHDGAWSYDELSTGADGIVADHSDWRGRRIGVACRHAAPQIALLLALDRLAAAAFLLPASMNSDSRSELASQYGLFEIAGDADAGNTLHATNPGAMSGEPGSVVLFTSGTSGPPKPAVHSWQSLSAAVSRQARNAGRRWLLAYDLARFAGLQVMLQSLATAGTLCVPASREPQDVLQCLRRDQVEFASGTPTFWRMLLGAATAEELAACSLAQITLGGEAVDQGVLDRLRQAFPQARISHIYASTEMGTCFVVNDGRAGFPAAFLDDATLPARLRIAEDGELWIASQRAMKEYLGETRAEREPWFATGDMVRQDGDRVFFVGRRTECINVGGAKVFPADVERVIRAVPGVREVRVHPIASSLVGQLVGAEIEPAPGLPADGLREAVLIACRRELVKYQIPAVVRVVDRLAINDAGKLARGGA